MAKIQLRSEWTRLKRLQEKIHLSFVRDCPEIFFHLSLSLSLSLSFSIKKLTFFLLLLLASIIPKSVVATGGLLLQWFTMGLISQWSDLTLMWIDFSLSMSFSYSQKWCRKKGDTFLLQIVKILNRERPRTFCVYFYKLFSKNGPTYLNKVLNELWTPPTYGWWWWWLFHKNKILSRCHEQNLV